TRSKRDWSSDVCSSDLHHTLEPSVVGDKPFSVGIPKGIGTSLAIKLNDGSGVFNLSRIAFPARITGKVVMNRMIVEIGYRFKPRSEERRVGKECILRRE